MMPRSTTTPIIMNSGRSSSDRPTDSMGLRVTAAMNTDGRASAQELQMPIMLMRRAALSMGPSIVTYGFIAACSTVFAVPLIKHASRYRAKLSRRAAGIKSPNATANMKNASDMVRLYPILAMMPDAGKLNTRKARNVAAMTRYDWAELRFRLFSRNGTK